MTKRFGHVPAWADEHFAKLSIEELEDLSLRVLDAQSFADMFGL
jgi:hypothetical protein